MVNNLTMPQGIPPEFSSLNPVGSLVWRGVLYRPIHGRFYTFPQPDLAQG